jgi:ATP-dependent Clp protease ATP-binding subunit ClpB
MDKLTTQFQQALAEAQSFAVGRDHQFIEPAHLMSALLEQEGGTVRGLLTKAGVNMNLLRSQLGEALDRLPTVEGTPGEIHIGNELAKLLNVTDKLAGARRFLCLFRSCSAAAIQSKATRVILERPAP